MAQDKMEQYVRLRKELEDMPGYQAILENHRLTNSIHIFDKNYEELVELLNFMEHDQRAVELLSLQGHKQLHSIDIELLRRLHNFVAGAKSLIDHTRRIYNKHYRKSKDFPEYSRTIQEQFANDPLSQFVQDLREYCQHYRSPALIYVTRYTNETKEEVREVALQLADLTSFDGWSSTAKQYLEGYRDNIPIFKPVQEYREKVLRFYEWFQQKQYAIHASDLNDYKAKETEMIIIQLEIQINIIISNIDIMPQHPDNPFAYIVSAEDMQKLKEKPLNAPDRSAYVLQMLESYFTVPEHIKEMIRLLYHRYNERANQEPA